MSKRSLRLSDQGSKTAQIALNLKGWTKEKLAIEAQLSNATIYNFFSSKPVDKENFMKLCNILQIESEVVADLSELENAESIEELVVNVRQRCQSSIIQKCGIMRILDMQYSIEVNHIYTTVNILEKITNKQRKSIDELTKEFSVNYFERLGLPKVAQERVPGLEAVTKYDKLMVLGKPGAGKTTFLRYLATQCISGNIFNNYVPMFIYLKDFANPDVKIGLLDYIGKELSNNHIDNNQIVRLFELGRILLLLDGLDEVRQEYDRRVLKEIRDISQRFPNNKFILTCRIAAKEYTFEHFTDVEVADFNQEQIQAFVSKWFSYKNNISNSDQRFMENLQNNQSIKELANNPLLLTLLCIEFEDAGDFPNSRAELYKRATHTLLRKWDATRIIERDNAYKHLSVPRKEDLLSYLALTTFEKGEYFWRQQDVQEYIASYIKNLAESSQVPEALALDSEAVLKSIEAQHGLLVERAREVYSFSHLTFHEYFAAKEIVSKANPNEFNDSALNNLIKYAFYKQWREVFLLTAEMLRSADVLLLSMKYQIDLAAAQNRTIQELLTWASQKSRQISSSHQPNAIKAFYVCLAVGICILDNTNSFPYSTWEFLEMSELLQSLDSHIQLSFYEGCASGFGMGDFRASLDDPNLALDLNLAHARAQASLLNRIANRNSENEEFTSISLDEGDEDYEIDEMYNKHPIDDTNFYTLSDTLYSAIALTDNQDFQQELIKLDEELPEGVYDHWDEYYHWYKHDSAAWGDKLKDLNRKYRNIDYDWQLDTEQEWGMLRAYCYANKLLLDCLQSPCYVKRETRDFIQSTLLLPLNEIEIDAFLKCF
ncbi:NACHT domain-containing NTPase [Phormidium sp. LEGE 05292]|uniref:NACHT domain-containing protein n=1 Tax=[Phormidium] sp. LEGE 05292 TaxID=767427 RepID=UPI00187F8176|nr:NACHT domain-containing NTPase [Phormidium sp. LEGE 05292]MBE9224725.1 NACHT domain-containing NTPase [Phormidium sp. LEGE 05292]